MTTPRGPGYFTAPRYEPVPVPEQDGARPVHPVVVVGAGPVGLTLALCLARQGVASVVLETRGAVGVGSRAICISARSLEILGVAGALDRVLDVALPWTGGRSYYRDRLVGEFTMAATGALPPMVNIQQCLLEQILVDTVAAEPLVDLRWHSRVTGLAQDAEGVLLDVASPLGDHAVRAGWTVACDGPWSPVREMLGFALEGETHEGRYVIVDLHLPSPRPAERLCWFDPPTFPGKTVLLHKQPRDIWRLDYQIDPGQSAEEATDPDVVLPLVAAHLEWIGETAPWSLEWLSSYRAHSLSLRRYRSDRVLLAGDAAHLVPIFGVRGLNGGLVDAFNASWKVAAVLRGASDALLDSYTDEQRHAAMENIASASQSARFMSPEHPARRLLRDAALSLAVSHPEFRALVDPRQTLPVAYPTSPLTTPDTDTWAGGPEPGALAPDVRPGAPPEFALLTFGGVTIDDAAGLPVVAVTDPASTAAFDGVDGAVYLLRPDRHVAARWRGPTDDDVATALRRASGGRVDVHV